MSEPSPSLGWNGTAGFYSPVVKPLHPCASLERLLTPSKHRRDQLHPRLYFLRTQVPLVG